MLDVICICFSLGVNNKLSGGKVTLLDSFWLPPYLPVDGGMHYNNSLGAALDTAICSRDMEYSEWRDSHIL
jgi:hypothetical protein